MARMIKWLHEPTSWVNAGKSCLENSMAMSSVSIQKNNFRGIIFMLFGIIFLSLMDAIAKLIVEADFTVVQLLAVRAWMVMILLILWMLYKKDFRQLKTKRPTSHIFRSIFGISAALLFFTSLQYIPLADATILFFVSPFIMTALSIPLFKEKVGLHRWGAILIGFVGVVIVTQPGSGSFQLAALLPLGASFCYVAFILMGRFLGSTETNVSIMFYVTLGTAILSSIALPWVWKPMQMEYLLVIAAMSFFYLGGSYCLLKAFITAEVGAVSQFEYTGILWAIILGYVFWGDVPENIVFIGAAIVMVSGIYMIYRENKLSKETQSNLDTLL
jgi:drug/metabolite transporter (DMT)-like permease